MTTTIEDAELIAAGVEVVYADEVEIKPDGAGQECVILNDGRIAPMFEVEARPHPTLGHTLTMTPEDFEIIGRLVDAWWAERVG